VPDRIIAVSILTNGKNSVLYTGVPSNLEKRPGEHDVGVDERSFAFGYRPSKLVYFETTPGIRAAIAREKQIKGGSRARKISSLEAVNPERKVLRAGI